MASGESFAELDEQLELAYRGRAANFYSASGRECWVHCVVCRVRLYVHG